MARPNRLKDAERLAREGKLEPLPRFGTPGDLEEQVKYAGLMADAPTERERKLLALEQLARTILRDES